MFDALPHEIVLRIYQFDPTFHTHVMKHVFQDIRLFYLKLSDNSIQHKLHLINQRFTTYRRMSIMSFQVFMVLQDVL